MGDKRINELTKIDSAPANGVLPIDVPGSTETNGITVANLLGAMFQEKGNVRSDLDNYRENGIYGVNKELFNTEIIDYGLLIVFSGLKTSTAGGGLPISQLLIRTNINTDIRIRTYWANTWTSWKSISIT